MKTEFTPGPWVVDKWGGYGCGGIFNDNLSIMKDGLSIAMIQSDISKPVEANAKLIAAAPELLKELNHLVVLLEPLEKDGSLDVPGLATLNGARAAIKKATK